MVTKDKLIGDLTSILSARFSTNTTYADQDSNFCDPGTRVEILDTIKKWAQVTAEGAKPLFWLSGVPGAGKSSIAASIARNFEDAGILWAQFFVNRGDTSTTKPKTIFLSLAKQLAHKSPIVSSVVRSALEKIPKLVNDVSDSQARLLFVEPIRIASGLNPSQPVVIVIDGLDECEGEYLHKTIKILSKAIGQLPSNAKVFISSRVEDYIQIPFSEMVIAERAVQVDLDPAAQSSIQDVADFLERRMQEMVRDYHLEEWDWPGEETMKGLCDKASGLFLWAATVVKFIRAQIEVDGSECLDDVLRDLSTKGMGDINELYYTILEQTCPEDQGDWALERFRRIVGCIVALEEPLGLSSLKNLLNIRKDEKSRVVDIKHFVRKFRTVLVAGSDTIEDKTVPRLHKSFVQFILSENAGRFRINSSLSNEEMALKCLRKLNSLSRDMCKIEHLAAFNENIPDLPARINKYLSMEVRYACRFWSFHLLASSGVSSLLHELRIFLNTHLLHWIEATSLLSFAAIEKTLRKAAEWAKVSFCSTL